MPATLEEDEYAWVGLHIKTEDTKLTKQVFDKLVLDKDDIEANINIGPGQEWHWYRQHATFFLQR